MRKATKIVISFAVVLIAGLNFIVPAFAQDPFSAIAIGGIGGASGAGLFGSMAGMSGIDIAWPQSGADPLDAMYNVLNPDHVYFSGEKHEATGIDEDVWDYITVDLEDWLDAQSDFIINFAQTYNVQDNSSGNISVYPSYGGYSFTTDVTVTSPVETWSIGAQLGVIQPGFYVSIGNMSLSIQESTPGWRYWIIHNADGTVTQYEKNSSWDGKPIFLGCNKYNINKLGFVFYNNGYVKFTNETTGQSTATTTVPWSSNAVNTSVFDGWENAKVKIPHSISGLSPNWTIPEFLGAINNLWTQNQQGQIVIEDTDQPVPPPPVPTTPLGEVPFDDWIDLWGQGIYQQLENQSDALDLIGSNGIDAIEELESIDTNTEDLVEVAESIDTNIGVGNGILGGIRSLAQSAVDYLEGIAEHVGELVEEIVAGTETLIAGILNQIPQAFGVIFGPIKQASSIWHYVVEWIQSIGAPFQFIWSMASGTSYNIILPVYASLAAAVVLAFFKRFGR